MLTTCTHNGAQPDVKVGEAARLLVMAPRTPGASEGRYMMMPTQEVIVSGSAECAGLSTDALAALHRLGLGAQGSVPTADVWQSGSHSGMAGRAQHIRHRFTAALTDSQHWPVHRWSRQGT